MKGSFRKISTGLAALIVLTLSFQPVMASRQAELMPSRTAQTGPTYDAAVLHVKFKESAKVILRGNQFISQSGNDMTTVNAVLDPGKTVGAARLFSAGAEDINQKRQHIKAKHQVNTPDLNSYYRVRLKPGNDSAQISQSLKSSAIVDEAYSEPLAANPPISPDYTALQRYFSPAESGMGISESGSFPGAKGRNAKLIDVEYSWNTNHEDLSKSRLPGALIANGTPADPFNNTNHGTSVAGIISGDRNSFGIEGIAPEAGLGLVNVSNTERGWDLANAIYTAHANLSAGDVILLEQQAWGPDGKSFVPVEWIPAVYDAIKLATAGGIIVVEAAGNSGVNLDDAAYGSAFPQGKPDSGAIIVGAGAACGWQPSRSKLAYSNYGSRVNVQSYGECVASAGNGDLYSAEGQNAWYTSVFNGTSSASALVAGVAVAVSSAYEELNGTTPTSAQLRNILVSTGSAQDTSINSGNIGPLPNLSAALLLSDKSAPTAPGNLSAASASGKAYLKWSASSDNVGVKSYQIYRNGVLITTTSSLSYTDSRVKLNKSYTYQVRAIDTSGNSSSYSNSATVKIRR